MQKRKGIFALLMAILMISSLFFVGCNNNNEDKQSKKTEKQEQVEAKKEQNAKKTEPEKEEKEQKQEEQQAEDVTFNVISDGSFTVTQKGIQKDFTEADNLKIEWYTDALCPDCCHAHQETEDFFLKQIEDGVLEIKYYPLDVLGKHSIDDYPMNSSIWVLGVAEFAPEYAMDFMGAVFNENFHPGFGEEAEERNNEAFVKLAEEVGVPDGAINSILANVDTIKGLVKIHSEGFRDNERLKALSPDEEGRVFVPFIVVNDQPSLLGEQEDTDKYIIEPIKQMVEKFKPCGLECVLTLEQALVAEPDYLDQVILGMSRGAILKAWGEPQESDTSFDKWIAGDDYLLLNYDHLGFVNSIENKNTTKKSNMSSTFDLLNVVDEGYFTLTQEGIQKDFTDKDNVKIEWYTDALCPDCVRAHQETEIFLLNNVGQGFIEVKFYPVDILGEHSKDDYPLKAAIWVLGVAEFAPEHAMDFMGVVFSDDFHPGFGDEAKEKTMEDFANVARDFGIEEDTITKIQQDARKTLEKAVMLHSEGYRDNEELKALSPDPEGRVFVPFIVVDGQPSLLGEQEDTEKYIVEPIRDMLISIKPCGIDCLIPFEEAFDKTELELLGLLHGIRRGDLHKAWGDPDDHIESDYADVWVNAENEQQKVFIRYDLGTDFVNGVIIEK